MSYSLFYFVVFVVGVAISLFFWGLGLVKGKRNNLVVGLAVFGMSSILFVFTSAASSGMVNTEALGYGAALFGAETVLVGFFSSASCPLKAGSRVAIGLTFVILGSLLLLIL